MVYATTIMAENVKFLSGVLKIEPNRFGYFSNSIVFLYRLK